MSDYDSDDYDMWSDFYNGKETNTISAIVSVLENQPVSATERRLIFVNEMITSLINKKDKTDVDNQVLERFIKEKNEIVKMSESTKK